MLTLNIILIVIFVLLQIFDLMTTNKVLNQGGREVWPTTKWILDKFGNKSLYAIKFIICVAWVGILYPLIQYTTVATFQIIFIAIYSYVVWKNYKQIKQD